MEGGEKPRGSWRDNLEAMTMAVVMALLLKVFIVEAYKIPTGSMQPTLIGDEGIEVFDRILVDKLSYRLRDPRRWEVAVFRYPLDRSKSFVKRIVGVGPEELRIDRGDVWRRADPSQPWEVLRRPRSVQRAVWKRLDREDPEAPAWEAASYARGWRFEGRAVHAAGDGRARWRGDGGPVRDHYLDGYPEALTALLPPRHSSSGTNHVGDLRVDGRLVADRETRWVTLELQEGDLRHRLRLPGPAAEAGARAEILTVDPAAGDEAGEPVRSSSPFRLAAGEPVRFGAQNLDDLLELEAGGETLVAAPIAAAFDQRAAVFLEVEGGEVSFEDLMVRRDIFYTPGRGEVIRIPEGHYFMLGDNTQDSSDGREWTLVRYATEVDGVRRVLRGNRRLGENPAFLPGLEQGPLTRFRDEWGEVHWFRSDEAEQLAPEEAPFVPREMILGNALAVFWPLSPGLGLYRLKWVN